MPRVKRDTSVSLNLSCDDTADSFVVHYDNQGDPFREGIEIGIRNEDFKKELTVMLISREAKQLRDLLIAHYPLTPQ
tara:strand:- start:474 stop:704 length:231 start_codon:yes stop_codon:yes gene_type:complete